MADSQNGRTLGSYRLVERIGVGGMGVVFRAVHLKLGRTAAVKILPEALATDQDFLRRFEREASSAAELRTPASSPSRNMARMRRALLW